MYSNAKNGKPTFGIVGLGRFGFALAHALAQSDMELLVLDKDEEKVREIRDYSENAFVVRSLDKKTLAETGIQNCDVVVVCIGEHMDTSILTTLHLVSMGVPLVIAKANSAEHGEILEKLGAHVVYPERDMALRLANRLENSCALDYVQLSEKINISKLTVPDGLIGKTVLETNLRVLYGLNIIAVENRGVVVETVKPEYMFCKNDILYISGSKEGLLRLSEWIEGDKHRMRKG